MQNRETIYAALFAQLQTINANLVGGAPAIQTFSRRFMVASRIDLQPALIMMEMGEEYAMPGARGTPNKVTLVAHAVLYTRDGADPNAVSATNLNRLIDSLDAVIGPRNGLEHTLGELVHWVRIAKRQTIYEAAQDVTQAKTAIEIQMLATT